MAEVGNLDTGFLCGLGGLGSESLAEHHASGGTEIAFLQHRVSLREAGNARLFSREDRVLKASGIEFKWIAHHMLMHRDEAIYQTFQVTGVLRGNQNARVRVLQG